MVFAMVPAAVGASAAVEAGLAGEMGAGAVAVAPGLLGAVPMWRGCRFGVVCRGVPGGSCEHFAVAGQHALARGLFSGAQSLAMATTVATEVMRAAAATI